MRFDLRDNCRFLHGCVALETKEKGLQLHRLTPSLQEIFCCTEHRWIRALCPSGIRILLKTDWSMASVGIILIGIVTFAAGWFAASKLGGE